MIKVLRVKKMTTRYVNQCIKCNYKIFSEEEIHTCSECQGRMFSDLLEELDLCEFTNYLLDSMLDT